MFFFITSSLYDILLIQIMIKTILKPVKTMKKPIKTQKTRISWFFQWFFHILMKKPGFLVFSEKTEKTINPGFQSLKNLAYQFNMFFK